MREKVKRSVGSQLSLSGFTSYFVLGTSSGLWLAHSGSSKELG